eukprot:g32290.t1
MTKLMDRWNDHIHQDLLPKSGSFHLYGGGPAEDELFVQFRRGFAERARRALPWRSMLGRVKIVIISCGYRPDDLWDELGDVTEDSAHVSSLIDAAQCVWFTSGDQSCLRGVLRGTALEKALQRLLQRHGAVGGTAAGASVLCALCPNFDEIMEGLDLIQGLALSHLLRRQRQHRLRAICDCFRPAWGLGLDEGAGLVLTPKKLQVSCWSPVLMVRHVDDECMAALLPPGFQGNLQELQRRMRPFGSINWAPEVAIARGQGREEMWSVQWCSKKALADGPIDEVQTNATFEDVHCHHFLSWKLPMEDPSSSGDACDALCFSSHSYLSISFDLDDLPLLCCLSLVYRTGEGGQPEGVEILLNGHLVNGDQTQLVVLPYKFVANSLIIPMGTLRLGQNMLRVVASSDVKSQSWSLLSDAQLHTMQTIQLRTPRRRRSSESPSSTPRWGYLHRGGPGDDLSEVEEPVRLNIYDLGKSNTVQNLNGWLKPVGIGAFHCAVQVYGVEWSYGRSEEGPQDPQQTGVWSCLPRMCEDHTFREDWPMSDYDLLNKNCCHFCEELCQSLGLGPLPSRVKKLAGLGATLNETAVVAADQVYQVASKVKSDLVGAGYVATTLAVSAVNGLSNRRSRTELDGKRGSIQRDRCEAKWSGRLEDDYLHRAGRTARYGEPGKVTSLVKKGDRALAKAIERSTQLGRPINELSKGLVGFSDLPGQVWFLQSCPGALQWVPAADLPGHGPAMHGAQQWRRVRHIFMQVSVDLPCINEVVATSSTSWQWPVALNDFLQIQERCDQKPKEPPRLRFWRSVREGVVPNQSIKSIHFGVGDLACTIVVCEVQDIQLQPDTVARNTLLAAFLPKGSWQQMMLHFDEIGDLKGFCCAATCYARAAQQEELLALLRRSTSTRSLGGADGAPSPGSKDDESRRARTFSNEALCWWTEMRGSERAARCDAKAHAWRAPHIEVERPSEPAPKQKAQQAMQLQMRQLELKQLELQVKLKRRLEQQAKDAKQALSAKQQQLERQRQHAFLEARERKRGLPQKTQKEQATGHDFPPPGGRMRAGRSRSASSRSRASEPAEALLTLRCVKEKPGKHYKRNMLNSVKPPPEKRQQGKNKLRGRFKPSEGPVRISGAKQEPMGKHRRSIVENGKLINLHTLLKKGSELGRRGWWNVAGENEPESTESSPPNLRRKFQIRRTSKFEVRYQFQKLQPTQPTQPSQLSSSFAAEIAWWSSPSIGRELPEERQPLGSPPSPTSKLGVQKPRQPWYSKRKAEDKPEHLEVTFGIPAAPTLGAWGVDGGALPAPQDPPTRWAPRRDLAGQMPSSPKLGEAPDTLVHGQPQLPRLPDAIRQGIPVIPEAPPGALSSSVSIPADLWQLRVRRADDKLLALRHSRSPSPSPRASPKWSSRPSPAFGTSDPVIPSLKIIQKYSDYFSAGLPSGNTYRGVRDSAGVREGWGMLNQKDGTTYAGQWVSGKRHGIGTLMFDGGIFEGQWSRGEATGGGIVRFDNGDKFEGIGPYGSYVFFVLLRYVNGQKNDWHVWSRRGAEWRLRYEDGCVVEAIQVGKTKKEKPQCYPRAREPYPLYPTAKATKLPRPVPQKSLPKASRPPREGDLQPQDLQPPTGTTMHFSVTEEMPAQFATDAGPKRYEGSGCGRGNAENCGFQGVDTG